jgi:hypothetical protein
MSEDKSKLTYVVWSSESVHMDFSSKSVAWVAARSRSALWWRQGYVGAYEAFPDTDFQGIVLFDNARGTIEERPREKLMLRDYFQPRADKDYTAFMVIPAPLGRSGSDKKVMGCIHISFRMEEDMGRLWNLPETTIEKSDGSRLCVPDYALHWHVVSWPETPAPERQPLPKDSSISATLRQAVHVIAEEVQGLNLKVPGLIGPR